MSVFVPSPPLPDLQAGDIMLYSPSDVVGWVIAIKTWTLLSHVEVYAGQGKSYGARIEGVELYEERVDKYLRFIRRPVMEPGKVFDTTAAYAAILPMLHQPYDVGGLFDFFNPWAKHRHASRICSVLATVYLVGGGCKVFNPDMPVSDASPAQLWQTANLTTIWTSSTKAKCVPPSVPSSPPS